MPPDFGKIRRSTDLSPQQMDQLIREHLPQDSVPVCKERAKVHKTLIRCMKQKNYKDLESELEKLRSNVVPLDEVLFTAMVFGYLQLPRFGLPAAESVCAEMQSAEFIHPALKRMVSGFLLSLRSLEKFDALPNTTAILKAYLPFMEIATEVRKLRILAFRVSMDERIKAGEVLLPAEPFDEEDLEDDQSLPSADLDEEDSIDSRTL